MADSGWYEDPTDNTILRWWDGAQWTADVSPNPAAQPPQPQPQQAPWDAPQPQAGYSYTGQAGQAGQDAATPPPWPPQSTPAASFDTGQPQQAPWDTPQTSMGAATSAPWAQPTAAQPDPYAPDPYAPQAAAPGGAWGDAWSDGGSASNYNPLSGYVTEEDDSQFGQSLYEVPDDTYETSAAAGGSLLQGPKKFIVLGGAIVLVLVLFMGVRSFLSGGGEAAAPDNGGQTQDSGSEGGGGVAPPEQTSESGVPLVQIPAWSQWPSVPLGYVIEYPKAPTLNSQSDRQVFTVQQDGAQYQLVVRSVDPQAVAALSGQERIELARRLILEQNPDATAEQVQNFTEADLGGLPARQTEWQKADGTTVVARFTFTQNRIYLLTAIGSDTGRFLDSFGWYREPPTL